MLVEKYTLLKSAPILNVLFVVDRTKERGKNFRLMYLPQLDEDIDATKFETSTFVHDDKVHVRINETGRRFKYDEYTIEFTIKELCDSFTPMALSDNVFKSEIETNGLAIADGVKITYIRQYPMTLCAQSSFKNQYWLEV